MAEPTALTPREVVGELDRHIVGQQAAKRAVAIALRNRWRRRRVAMPLRDEIVPKNIILIGATGVGKTEIARRLAKLAQAPFVKVEASKFTEVGYMGRDVEAIVRDLADSAVAMVRDEAKHRVMEAARAHAEDRVLDVLLPRAGALDKGAASNDDSQGSRERLRTMLRDGTMAERQVEIDAEERRPTALPLLPGAGMEEMGANLQEMLSQVVGRRTRKRRVKVPEALEIFAQEEAQRRIDQDEVHREGLRRAAQDGIVFLDEIDKIARREGSGGGGGPDVSREGVQRDILPIVEGSAVTTKYGTLHTDHILFIAAGAFHVSRVADLIPELQGRFPIRVELEALGEAELLRILREPQNALPVQYAALLAAEGVTLEFTDGGLQRLAQLAAEANARAENIGARRLHTVMEKLLEDALFAAPERRGSCLTVDAAHVDAAVGPCLQDEDLQRYIL